MILLGTARLRGNCNQVISALLAGNIGASMHFYPLHMLPYYRDKYGYKPKDSPVACRVGESEILLPFVPQMKQQDAEDVVSAIQKLLGAYRN